MGACGSKGGGKARRKTLDADKDPYAGARHERTRKTLPSVNVGAPRDSNTHSGFATQPSPGSMQHVLDAVAAGDQQVGHNTSLTSRGSGPMGPRAGHQAVDLHKAGSAAIVSDSDEWLSDLIDVMWPFLRAAANNEALSIAGPVLENVPPFVANVLLPGVGTIVAVPISGISAAIRLLDVLGPNPPQLHITRVSPAPDGGACLTWRCQFPMVGAAALTITPSKEGGEADAAGLAADTTLRSTGTRWKGSNNAATTSAAAAMGEDVFEDARPNFKASDENEDLERALRDGLSIGEWAAVGPQLPPVEELQGSLSTQQTRVHKKQPAGTILASCAIESSLDISGSVTVSLQSLADAIAAGVRGNGGDGGGVGVELPGGLPATVDTARLRDKSWFNQFLNCVWPQIRPLAAPFVTEIAPKFIQPFKPYWISEVRLGKLDVGSAPPYVKSVSIFQDAHDVTPDLMLDIDLEWHTEDMLAEVVVQMVGKRMRYLPEVMAKAISSLITFRGGINDFWIKAKLRIMLRPLLERLPVLGAVQVAFVELPKFGMDLTAYGGEMWMLNPIKSFFFNIIRDAVLGQYVFPDALSVPIDQTVRPINPPEGLLEVTVVEARNIPRMDWWPGSHADMFCELWVSKSSKQRTRVVSGTKAPKFGDTFAFPVHFIARQECKVVCWDVDPLSNEEMGRVAVPLSSLKEGTIDIWVEVPRTQHTVATSGWPHAVEVPPESKAFALKLRLTWDEFNEEEIGTIVQAQMHGPLRVLQTAAGRSLPEAVQMYLLRGSLKVIVEAARGTGVKAGSRVMVDVRVGSTHREEFGARCTRVDAGEPGGTVATFAQYLSFDLDLNDSRLGDCVDIGLRSGQGNSLGGVSLPMRELLDRNIAGWRRLEGGDPEAELMLFSSWSGTFD